MFLYKLSKDQKLTSINEKPFQKEKDLQALCEKNLEAIFGVKYIRSEFALNGFRIDTLAFDPKTKAFVIIEYKKDKSFSVIDQGYAYLSVMLSNKADFILEYNENCKDTLKKADIDWSQSRVLFVAPSFTPYQKQSINFKDLPIELWEVKQYENDTIYFAPIKTLAATESIKTISKGSETIKEVSREIKVYTEDDHLKDATEDMKELYFRIKEAILNISGDISLNPTKMYLAFVSNKSNIADLHILKNSVKIWINLKAGELDDPKKLARDVSEVGHWGNGDYEVQIADDENLDYVIGLIKQSYQKNMRRKQ